MESWVQSWRPRTNAFCVFPLHLPKVLRLPRKSGARSYEVLHVSRKIIFPKLKIWCSKMQPLSGNQRPHALQMSHACHRFWKCYKTLAFCSLLTRCRIPCRSPRKTHLNLQKWSEHVVPLTFWLWYVLRASSRHNGVHFFDIATSKSAPNLVCFVHFDYQMCFTPKLRALFHLDFQKWSEPGVLCTLWVGSLLRATTARTFSTLQLQKVLRTWCVLYILTWKCASRHNCVHFFILTSKSVPNLVCFVHFDLETCFAPQLRALFHLNF